MKRRETMERTQPGDVAAQKHWLAMRQRALWQETTKSELTINQNVDVRFISEQLRDTKQLSTEELKVALKLAMISANEQLQQKALAENGN